MEWYKVKISYEDAINQAKDEAFINLLKAYHSLSVSLESVVLYRTPLDGSGTSFFLHCGDEKVLSKLRQDFKLEKAPQPDLDELVPVYGEFLGEDVAEIFGMEIEGERAPSSAPPFAEPGRGFKERIEEKKEERTHPAQQERKGSEEGRATGSKG